MSNWRLPILRTASISTTAGLAFSKIRETCASLKRLGTSSAVQPNWAAANMPSPNPTATAPKTTAIARQAADLLGEGSGSGGRCCRWK